MGVGVDKEREDHRVEENGGCVRTGVGVRVKIASAYMRLVHYILINIVHLLSIHSAKLYIIPLHTTPYQYIALIAP